MNTHTHAHTRTHTQYKTHSRDAAIPVDVLAGGAPSGGLGVTTNPPLPPVVAVVVALSPDDAADGRIGNNAIAGTGLRSPSLSVQNHNITVSDLNTYI